MSIKEEEKLNMNETPIKKVKTKLTHQKHLPNTNTAPWPA
jgi:hypothetical protein